MIRVLLADDNAYVRSALAELFASAGDFRVVAECADGDGVVSVAQETHPDVVLLDLTMPRVDGFQAARDLLAVQPAARIVFLTADATAAAMRKAQDLGAVGYLLKDVDPEELCRHLRRVAAGGTAWDRNGQGSHADMTKTQLADTFGHDTPRTLPDRWSLWS